jgi:hypothetical protein
MSTSAALELHVNLFNKYKDIVDASRSAICRHIMYLLKPSDGYPKGSDSKLTELLNIWQADSRAMDAALKEHWHSGKPLPIMPPDDAEHRLCRRLAAIHIEGLMYGEDSAQHYLDPLIEEMLENEELAYHPHSCACHDFTFWTYGNSKKLEKVTQFYRRLINGANGGADGPPPIRETAYIYSRKYNMLGTYEVVKCGEGYVFVLKVPVLTTQVIGSQVLVPLEEPMGVGDFVRVTPDKFNW